MKTKLNEFLKNKYLVAILSLLFVILHFFIVKGRVKVTFQWPNPMKGYVIFLIGLAFALCFSIYLLLFTSIQLLFKKDKVFLSYFKYFCVYGVIMGIFFLLTWPGIFKGDEFYVIKSALSMGLSPAQTGLTSFFYIACLIIFPSMATITAIQLLVICIIFAYVMKNLFELYPSKLTWIMLIPFVLLPVIDGNLFTLRATLVGWLCLFIFANLFFSYKKGSITLVNCVFLSILAGLVIAWRSEFVYLILLLPVALCFLKLINVKRMLCLILTIAISFSICNGPNKIALNGSNKYPISLVLNPIANLFTHVEDLKGPDVYDDVQTINELVDAALLRRSASVRNISQYWNIPDVLPKEQLNRFMKASLRLIVYNPGLFLYYRTLTYLHTNGFYKDEMNHPGGESIMAIRELVYYDIDFKQLFVLSAPPLGIPLREKVLCFLGCKDYTADPVTTNATLPIFYNSLPTLILCFVGMVLSMIQKRKDLFCLQVLTIIQVPLIFLTAPAMFFMYYFCFYLCGYFVSFLQLTDWLYQKKSH